jgi:hypothetical protein
MRAYRRDVIRPDAEQPEQPRRNGIVQPGPIFDFDGLIIRKSEGSLLSGIDNPLPRALTYASVSVP